MIIYNVTIKVDHSIAKEWEAWMKKEHLPEVLGTGCFERHQFVRLLEVDETEGPTYAAQYFATDKEKYEEYISTFAPLLRQKSMEAWGDKFIAFRSLMEILE